MGGRAGDVGGADRGDGVKRGKAAGAADRGGRSESTGDGRHTAPALRSEKRTRWEIGSR